MRIASPGEGARESTEHVGIFLCQRAAAQRWHGPFELQQFTCIYTGGGYGMDMRMDAKQSGLARAGSGLELQRRVGPARHARFPLRVLIGQVERPDVTPNPSAPVTLAPCVNELKALQGSLGTSPPLFVASTTGPSHDVMKGFKLANYNKPFLSKQPPLKEIFLCCTLGYPHSCRFLNLPNQTQRGLTLPGFFCFDFFPPEYVSSLLFFFFHQL